MKRALNPIPYRTPPRSWRGRNPTSVLVVLGIVLWPLLVVLCAVAILRLL
jgi:hypothetical protein